MSASADVVNAPYEAPAGLAGVSVARTQVSDVLGRQGFYHYRGYNAVDIARRGRVEDAWHLLLRGELPTPQQRAAFASQTAAWRQLPDGVADCCPRSPGRARPARWHRCERRSRWPPRPSAASRGPTRATRRPRSRQPACPR